MWESELLWLDIANKVSCIGLSMHACWFGVCRLVEHTYVGS